MHVQTNICKGKKCVILVHAAFLCVSSDLLCAEILCYTVRIRKAWILCVFCCVWWGSNSDWRLFHTPDTCVAFHLWNMKVSFSLGTNATFANPAWPCAIQFKESIRLLIIISFVSTFKSPVWMNVCFFISDFWWNRLPQYWQGYGLVSEWMRRCVDKVDDLLKLLSQILQLKTLSYR